MGAARKVSDGLREWLNVTFEAQIQAEAVSAPRRHLPCDVVVVCGSFPNIEIARPQFMGVRQVRQQCRDEREEREAQCD